MRYIINDYCNFDGTNGEIMNNLTDEQAYLDWLERQVLRELIYHVNKCVTFESLRRIWNKKHVSKKSIWRVMSCIRLKLNSVGLDGQYIIINIPKSGYMLNAKIDYLNLDIDKKKPTFMHVIQRFFNTSK